MKGGKSKVALSRISRDEHTARKSRNAKGFHDCDMRPSMRADRERTPRETFEAHNLSNRTSQNPSLETSSSSSEGSSALTRPWHCLQFANRHHFCQQIYHLSHEFVAAPRDDTPLFPISPLATRQRQAKPQRTDKIESQHLWGKERPWMELMGVAELLLKGFRRTESPS